MAQLESLMERHFVDYASYSILDRAIPDIRDGLKPVQRRILHTLFEMEDGRFHKVANVIGETMKLHPHGDAAIGDALVVLANKDYFIERQGNFGNLLTGHPAAAARYIECRLTPLARETLFDEDLTETVPSYDGRTREPVFLPAKLPVALMLGTEGIAVGMSTRILPHNLLELWEAQIAILRKKPFTLFPDFAQGGLMDVSEYDDGRGKVQVRARVEARDEKHVVIREIPFGTTTEGLIASIEAAVQKGRVKVASIDDFTTDEVEIEISLPRGVGADEVIPQLYAYTDCAVSVSSNLTVIRDRRPIESTVSDVLKELTAQLKERLRLELEHRRARLEDRRHWLTLEQIFVEKRVYKKIETAKTAEAVRKAVVRGMEAHRALFVRDMVDEDVTRLLDLRIRRISAYDIERNRREVEETLKGIREIDDQLKHLTRTAIRYVQGLIEKYGELYPRRTRIEALEEVDAKAVAAQTLRLAYDAKSGFFGSQVRGDSHKLTVSEFDPVLAISSDGSYRIMTAPEKVLFGGRLLHASLFDPEAGARFTVVYRDDERRCFAKRIHIQRYVRNREYRLFQGERARVELLLEGHPGGEIEARFVPAKRQRLKSVRFDLDELPPTGVGARGTRLAAKPVSKVVLLSSSPEAPPSAKAESSARTPGAQEPGRKKASARKASARKTSTKKATSRKPSAKKPVEKKSAEKGARKQAARKKGGRRGGGGPQGSLF